MVYQTKIREIIDLLHRITEATIVFAVDMLARARREIEHLLDILCAVDYVRTLTGVLYIEKAWNNFLLL